MRRTKIVATLGPASSTEVVIRALVAAGVDVFRLNFSHGSRQGHGEVVALVRRTAAEAGRHVALLQDLSGPKIRIGLLRDHQPLTLSVGDPLTIELGDFVGGPGRVSTTYAALPRHVKAGDTLLLDDGRIELRVEPLAKRRAEIAPLARLFAHHFAAHSGLRTPMLEDSALAFLWRQPWPGNVRELAQWRYRLVLCPVDRAVDAGMFMGLAERFGHEALARLPSRHPDKDLLISALKCTATGKGTWNKTRAALYLGWDTDTLQNRILEAGLTCENG